MARRAVCFGAKMTRSGSRRLSSAIAAALFGILLVITVCSAERAFPSSAFVLFNGQDSEESAILKELVTKAGQFIWQPHESEYQHIWPPMKFGWEIVLGTMIAFFGAAVGSVGGVGGGGIFVPMLTLIIGFDAKSSTAISKCMIMGAAGSTVYYNLKMKHPTLDLPIIDYDLAMVFQPMLMLGISIGVAFNVIFADWMVTVLLIILFIATSLKACFKGIETWKQETSQMKEKEEERSRKKPAESAFEEDNAVDFTPLPGEPEPNVSEQTRNDSKRGDVADTVLLNIRLKELAMLLFVWFAFLVLQIAKTHSATCSTKYWVFNFLQVPVAFSVSLYEAVSLYRGTKVVASKGAAGVNWRIPQICLYLFCGIVAGVVGGLLGLGGGFILGPLLLELGIPPQVSSATATFVMMFSSSMSVVEYYFLKRFPVPYAAYLFVVCFIAALWGQHVIRKLVILLGRASLIIFTLAFVIFLSAITLGGVGIVRMITKIQKGEYMGFENLCTYDP